jgi:four helix bundle protein
MKCLEWTMRKMGKCRWLPHQTITERSATEPSPPEATMARDFRKIKAWQLADDLTVEIYQTTKRFSREELYGLTSQIRRASCSVAANIAEGANRATRKDYLHFLNIGLGSLAETEYFLHLSNRLGYISSIEYGKLDDLRHQTARTLSGLIKAVQLEYTEEESQART